MIKNPLVQSLLSAAIFSVLAIPMAAHATNGYFLPGYGAKSIGMGGVGVAYAQDSLAAAANPAGIAGMGFRVDLGLGLFSPNRSAEIGTAAGGTDAGFGFSGSADSSNKLYPVPNAGFTMDFDDRLSLGFALIANGGMNTTYYPNFFGLSSHKDQKLGVDMMQMLMPITAAYKVDEHNAVGFSFVPAIQTFAARGLFQFGAFGVSSDKEHLTDNGRDNAHGAGIRLGWMGKYFDDRLTLGATYASKIRMSKFKRYSGLFAEGGGFDIPANYAWGIAFKPTPKVTIAFDSERILYADIRSVHNQGPTNTSGIPGVPAFNDPSTKLGLDNGMGFGWDNQQVYKFGVDYKYNEAWVFRTGYNYGHTPIPNEQLTFNTLAPAVVEKHYTMGFTYSPDKSSEMTFAYLHAMGKKQSGCNNNIVNCVSIQMYQNDFEFSYAWKF